MSSIWEQVIWDESTVKILKMLKNGMKKFTEFINGGVPRTTLDRRLKQLGVAGLIEFYRDFSTGKRGYKLTPLGLKILEKLEEIEKVYQEEMEEAPPKEPEEFTEELIKEK